MERKVLLNLLGVSDMKTDDIQYIDHQMHYSTVVSYLDNSVEEKKLSQYIQYQIMNLASDMYM